MTNNAISHFDDPDDQHFASHAEQQEWLRQAKPGEWPEDNELLTSPPFTLVIRVNPNLLLKFGAWRSNANMKNTYVQLQKGRIPVYSYLEYLTQTLQ
jgi:hypothetical protein